MHGILDKYERIAFHGQYVVTVLSNGSELELVDMDAAPLPQSAVFRGFHFVGVVGLIDGALDVALAEPLDNATISAMSQAYLQFFENKLREQDASVAWCKRLFSLPDNRTKEMD